jgi:hypothetical protein
VDRDVGLEVLAAQLVLSQDLRHALQVVTAVVAVRAEKGHVRVVGAGQGVVDEGARVRIARTDSLVVAGLTLDRRGPATDQSTGVGLERLIGRVDAHLEAGDAARVALGLRQTRPVQRQEQHHLDQPVDVEALARVVGVHEPDPVYQLRDDVLDLDPGIHLHEEVVEAFDDALEGRDAVEPRRLAEARALGLHAL